MFSFKHSNSCQVSIGDHHCLICFISKSTIFNSEAKLVTSREYSKFFLRISKIVYTVSCKTVQLITKANLRSQPWVKNKNIIILITGIKIKGVNLFGKFANQIFLTRGGMGWVMGRLLV